MREFKDHLFARHRQQVPETTACYICERNVTSLSWNLLHQHVLGHVLGGLYSHRDYQVAPTRRARGCAHTRALSLSPQERMDAFTTIISDDEETDTLPPSHGDQEPLESPSEVELFSPEVVEFVFTPTIYLTPTSPPCEDEENPLV